MYQWQTLWSLSGPELPDEAISVAQNIHIRPRNASEAATHSSSPLSPTVSVPGGLYVVNHPPRDEVHGSHRLQVDVKAKTEDEAISEAEKTCERLTASLSLAVSGTPYFFELLRIRRVDQKEEYSGWSQAVRFSQLVAPTPLKDSKLKLSLDIAWSIENNETANNAFLHLSTAWQLQATSGSKPLQRSILQHYVLCIEAIVNGAMGQVRKGKKEEIRIAEQKYSNEFAENLGNRVDKAKAIREASTALREISLVNMIPSLDAICPMLGIPSNICASAKDLYRFRSRNLSHPGKKQDAEMKKWLNSGPKTFEHCLADTVARAFLLSYCQRLSR
ncbi:MULTISPECIES: hypothetical protein [unclassified Yoonia]|uniref:hypothetical protein n=1 Tax=unclassified Yoonia TaxID=2629118 RepID=UPI002AFE76F9|nr:MULTISPECIES: hypothetical protein [unclassified Yoonia]